MDKLEVIDISVDIGTYNISILPMKIVVLYLLQSIQNESKLKRL